MNTSKQINVMILLLFGSVLVFAGYTLWDPDRADEAEGNQAHSTVRRGAYLFSQNCRTCHGDAGEGGVAADRLRAAPPLNRPDLQGEVDGEVTDVTFSNAYRFVYDTITCGRVGKVMPAWGQSQGGPLNEEQIKQITEFITRGGDEGWATAADFGRHNHHDLHLESADDKNELRLTSAIDEDDTVISLEALVDPPEGSTVNAFVVETPREDGSIDQTSLIAEGTRLSILEEVEEPAEGEAAEGDEEEVVIPQTIEIMLVTAVDLEARTVTVERGVGGTSGAAHAAGTDVLQPPVPPEEPQVVERSCGQIPQAQATLAPPAPTADITITASGTAWNYSQLSAVEGAPLTITVQNNDADTQHNWVLHDGEDGDAPRLAETPIEAGVVTQTLNFGPLDAGDYYYNCEVHPGQMEGVLTAYAPGDGPEAAATPSAAATPTP